MVKENVSEEISKYLFDDCVNAFYRGMTNYGGLVKIKRHPNYGRRAIKLCLSGTENTTWHCLSLMDNSIELILKCWGQYKKAWNFKIES